MRNIQRLLTGWRKDDYETHRNTAHLLQAVVASLDTQELSGDDIWQLMRLTWMTHNVHGFSENHWQTLKIPALASLFRKPVDMRDDLPSTVRPMRLPARVASAARLDTGVINFRNVWRNTAKVWCEENRNALRAIIQTATQRLSLEDRIGLATLIGKLPDIPSPNDRASARAVTAFSPVVAFLDKQSRFPIINGRPGVTRLLTKLCLSNRKLEDQVLHLTGLIGQFGIEDSFLLDMFAEEIAKIVTAAPPIRPEGRADHSSDTPLPEYDLAERLATQKAMTVVYRQRHNKMTAALKGLFGGDNLKTSNDPDCDYDVLVKNYDQRSRDLLIEAKPEPEKGAIRIAIGQLLDYRRFLDCPAATDLAILTILPPSESHVELLDELQITALWYTDETCRRLGGSGRAWPAIKAFHTRSR